MDIKDKGSPDLGAVVDLMYYDIMHPQSFEHPEITKHVGVYGGNGYCSDVVSLLSQRLGEDYTVEHVDSSDSGNLYTLDIEHYISRANSSKDRLVVR